MRVFIPFEDAPSSASIPMLVPYRCGLTCEHALRESAHSKWPRNPVSPDEGDAPTPALKQLAQA
ncbi:MAG: hypothetical protein ABI866_09790 [Dokdonella sp.]